jgi:hypothetical protein
LAVTFVIAGVVLGLLCWAEALNSNSIATVAFFTLLATAYVLGERRRVAVPDHQKMGVSANSQGRTASQFATPATGQQDSRRSVGGRARNYGA